MTTVPLPAGYTMRPPTLADAAAVARVIAACEVQNGDRADSTAEGVLNDWAGTNLTDDVVVIVGPAGDIVAYADIFNRRNVLVSVYGGVHPDYQRQGLGAALVAWGEAWAAERLHRAPAEAQVAVQHYLRSTDAAARRLLARQGYTPVRGIYVMTVEFDEAPPAPAAVAGVRLRTFVPGQDERATFDAVEDAFRDIWGRPPGLFTRWLDLTESERRDPGLWFLAEDLDTGTIVGAALGKIVSGSGWVGTVGVRREWRGHGLGLALLRATLGAFYQRGVRLVELSVDSESITGAPRLYARAGMRVTRDYLLHRKVLRPGIDLAALAP